MESLLEALSAALAAIVAFLFKKFKEKNSAQNLLEAQKAELEKTIENLKDKNTELRLKIDHQVQEFEEKMDELKEKNVALQTKIEEHVDAFKSKVHDYDELLKKYTSLEDVLNQYKKQLEEKAKEEVKEVAENGVNKIIDNILKKK